jgi:ABC-2 type transport system ATP-binding protein
VIKYLLYQGILNQLHRKEALDAVWRYLDQYGLASQSNKRLHELSPEQQEKILIIGAILHDPDIIAVDEPFSGFVQTNVSFIESLLGEFKKRNKTVLLATRQLDQAENICDRVCLLNEGKLILNMGMPEIRNRVKENVYYLETADDLSFLKQMKEVQLRTEEYNKYKISIKDRSFDARKLLTILNKNIKIIKFGKFQPGLIYIYARLVKNLQRSKK